MSRLVSRFGAGPGGVTLIDHAAPLESRHFGEIFGGTRILTYVSHGGRRAVSRHFVAITVGICGVMTAPPRTAFPEGLRQTGRCRIRLARSRGLDNRAMAARFMARYTNSSQNDLSNRAITARSLELATRIGGAEEVEQVRVLEHLRGHVRIRGRRPGPRAIVKQVVSPSLRPASRPQPVL